MSSKKRLNYLDAIRGIAALLVFVQHVVLYLRRNESLNYNFEQITSWTVDFLDFGKIGVVLFFMLSGFLIPFSLKKNSTVKNFVIKRFFRLYPVFWVSILIGIVFLFDRTPDFKTIFANITMIPEILGAKSIIGIYWTLQIELIFYGFCVLLFIVNLLHKFKGVFLSSIGFLIIALVASIVRFYLEIKLPIALFLALSLMFYGYLLRSHILYLRGDKSIVTAKNNMFVKVFPVIFMATMLAISFLAYNKNYGHNEVWYRYFLSYAIAFVLFLLLTSRVKIKNRILAYFGKISYSFYLFHVVIIHIVGNIDLESTFINNVIFTLLSLSLTTIVSIIGFKLIEETFIKFGYKFIGK